MWSESFSPHLTRLSSSVGFRVVSRFLAFEAPPGCWKIRFNPLKTIADLHLFGSMKLIKYQDGGVGLDLFLVFSNEDFSDVCHSIWFYGISTLVGYLMPTPFYTYI